MFSTEAVGVRLASGKHTDVSSLPRGKGGAIEFVCMVMVVLSLLGAILGAIAFTEVPRIGYSGVVLGKERSGLLVALWLGSGMGSALVWWVLSGVGTALCWLEVIGTGVVYQAIQSGQVGTTITDTVAQASTSDAPGLATESLPTNEADNATRSDVLAGSPSNTAVWIVIGLMVVLALLAANGVLG